MIVDHSLSYKGFGIRAISHRYRLKTILNYLKNLNLSKSNFTCLDIGCSNGFITKIIQKNFNINYCVGFDCDGENIARAKQLYPSIKFEVVNLNIISEASETFDLVCCFETLEHVGNIVNALKNILLRISPGGTCLISVPIEHGARGIMKYLVKKFVFQYPVSELKISEFDYLKILLGKGRISESRKEADGYGTHFGFDYRDVDDFFIVNQVRYKAYNKGMTRFYIITV